MKKNISKNKIMELFIAGLILISTQFFVKRYFTIPDFLGGIIEGIGVGLLIYGLVSLIRVKRGSSACASAMDND